jgi:hypothetical protein
VDLWKAQAACTRIIVRLVDAGPASTGNRNAFPQVLQPVAKSYRPVRERELTGILQNADGFNTTDTNSFVYAPQIRRGTPTLWPIMAFSAGKGFADLRIRVALFHHQSSRAAGSDDARPAAVAYRFEPPEGDRGAHCYYHVQPISRWDNDESAQLPVAQPLNESHPAFPLRARDSVGLLGEVLVSLYGHEFTQKFLGHASLRNDIARVKGSFEGTGLLNGS